MMDQDEAAGDEGPSKRNKKPRVQDDEDVDMDDEGDGSVSAIEEEAEPPKPSRRECF